MVTEIVIKLIIGAVFIILGFLLSFNNKKVSIGASKFYRAFFPEKNLKIMFRIVGIILIIAGLVLIFVN